MVIFEVAGWRQRAGGLLIRPKLLPGEVLLLQPCWAIHTFFMTYPIAIFFLDKKNVPLKVYPFVPPNKIAYCVGAYSACEMLPIADDYCSSVSVALTRSLALKTAL